MKSKTGFFASFVTVVLLHTYVLSSYKVEQEIYVAQYDAKGFSVINLQQVALLGPEPLVGPVVEEEASLESEPVTEEVFPEPESVIEEVSTEFEPDTEEVSPEPEPVIEEMVPEPIKKEEVIKKKRVKKKKTIKSDSKRRSGERFGGEPGGVPGGQAGGHPGGQPGGEIGGQLSAPRQLTVSELYILNVRKMIERKKRYPKIAKKMGQEGNVHIIFTISKNGAIRDIGLAKKSSYERLNRAAVGILKGIGSFPPIPEEIGEKSLSLSVTIKYKILN